MKIRQAFVANSSSSSFVCDLCGEEFSGWDASPSEFEHFTCENEHIVCYEGMIGEYEGSYDVPAEHCPFCMFLNFCDRDMKSYLKKKFRVKESVVFEKVKSLNKRRRKLYDVEYVNYVYENCNTSSTVEEAFIKENFKNFDEFNTYCHS